MQVEYLAHTQALGERMVLLNNVSDRTEMSIDLQFNFGK